MAERKKHLGTIQVRIQTPSNNTESSIAGGLNEYVTSHMIEEGMSNVLGVITGNDNIKAFKDLATLKVADKSILNPVFTTELSDIVKSIDKNVSKSIDSLDSINNALETIITMLADNDSKQAVDTTAITLAVDKTNAANITKIIDSIKDLSTNEQLKTALMGLKNIEKFFTKLNELFDENDGIIPLTSESMMKIFPVIEKNAASISEIVKLYAVVNSIGSFDASLIENAIQAFSDVYKAIGDNLVELAQIDFTNELTTIKERLASIQELYNTDIAATAAAINSHSADVTTIQGGTEAAYDVAISGNDLDEDDLETSMDAVAKTIDAITLMGVCMLIGGAIINRHPDLIIGSLKFGATLAAFLLELMIPLVLLNKLSGSIESSADTLATVSGFVVIASLVMTIGGAFAMKDRFVKGALRFGVIFALFLFEIFKAIDIAIGLKDNKTSVDLDGLAGFVTRAALIMTIGGLFMTSTLIIPALKFGVVFALFLTAVLLPLKLIINGTKKEAAALEGVGGLLFACMGLMLLGAYIVSNTELIKNALKFGAVFGLFLFVSFAPLRMLKFLSLGLSKLIDSVGGLLIKCTLVMLIGALFVSQPKLWKASLQFGILMGAFIFTVVAPLWAFNKTTKWAWAAILSVTLFIQTVAATMLIGALIIRNPRTVASIFGFALVVAGFIELVLLPFRLHKRKIKAEWKTLLALSVFVLVTGHVLKVAARITNKYGWEAVAGAAIMALFTLAMVTIMKKLGTIRKTTLANVLITTIGIAGVVIALAFALKIVRSADVKIGDVLNLSLMMVVTSMMMFMVKMITQGVGRRGPKFLRSVVGTGGLTMKDVLTGLALMGGIALTILMLGVTLAIVHRAGVTINDVGNIMLMMAAASVMLLLVNLIVRGGTIGKRKIPGATQATAVAALELMAGIAGVILAIGFALKMVSDANVSSKTIWQIIGIMTAASVMLLLVNLIVRGGKVGRLNIPGATKDKSLAALAILGAISLVILSIGYSLKLIAESGATEEHLKMLGIMTAVVGVMAILIAKFGGINPLQAAGALIVLGTLTAIVIGLAYAISLVAKSGANNDTLKLIGIMTAIVVALGALCLAIGALSTGPVGLFLGVGVAIIASLVGIVWEIGKAIQAVATAAMMADAAKDRVPSLKTFFENFLDTFNGINIVDFAKSMTKAKYIKKLLNRMVPPMSRAADLVAQVASLTIPIEWDPKTGRATNFRRLSPTDFATASSNISLIIGTLAEGLVKTASTLFEDGGPTYKQLKRTIRLTRKMGRTISSIATGIQQYAKLMVADDWTEDGKPKHYTRLTKQDFKNAAENITTIIALLGGTIANIANGEEITVGGQKIDTTEWIDAMDGTGFLKLGTSRFGKVLNASTALGKMISNIATGIQAFANMTYADAWDEHGKPISFKRLGDAEIKSAQENIISIITATTQPIMQLANSEYADLFKEVVETRKKGWGFNENITLQSPFMAVLSGCMGIGEMIANLSLGIQSMANLAIPDKWDETGKPIHYIKMNPEEVFPKVKQNIKEIITASINGVTDAMKNTTFDSETISAVLSSVQPVGELVASLARGIKDIAELKIATGYDANGNATGYIPLSKQDFMDMRQNIADIISGSMTAVINSWDSLPDEYKETEKFTSIMNALTNVGAVVEMAAGCVTSLISNNVNESTITNANANVISIFDNVIGNVLTKAKDINDEYGPILNRDSEMNINTILSMVNTAISTLGRIMKTASEFNEYKIDPTNINKVVGENGILSSFIHNINGFEYVNVGTIDNLTSLIASSIELFDMSAVMAKKLNDVKGDINAAAVDASNTFNNIASFITLVRDTADTALATYTSTEQQNIIKRTIAVNLDIAALTDIISSMTEFAKSLPAVNEMYNEFFIGETNSLTNLKEMVTKINTTTSAITAIYTSTDDSLYRDTNNAVYSDKLNQLWRDVNFFTTAMEILGNAESVKVTTFSLPSGVTTETLTASIKMLKDIIDTSFIGQLNTISPRSLSNSIEIMESFDDVILKLIDISAHASAMSTMADISVFATVIKKLNDEITNIDEKKAKLISNEATTLDSFVRTIDRVDVSKVGRMTGLMESMANLADKMGGFDKVVELMNGDLKNVLAKLSDKITDAKKTIDKAERIENERQKKLNSNLDKIKEIMKQSITVNVGKLDENNNLAAGTESK